MALDCLQEENPVGVTRRCLLRKRIKKEPMDDEKENVDCFVPPASGRKLSCPKGEPAELPVEASPRQDFAQGRYPSRKRKSVVSRSYYGSVTAASSKRIKTEVENSDDDQLGLSSEADWDDDDIKWNPPVRRSLRVLARRRCLTTRCCCLHQRIKVEPPDEDLLVEKVKACSTKKKRDIKSEEGYGTELAKIDERSQKYSTESNKHTNLADEDIAVQNDDVVQRPYGISQVDSLKVNQEIIKSETEVIILKEVHRQPLVVSLDSDDNIAESEPVMSTPACSENEAVNRVRTQKSEKLYSHIGTQTMDNFQCKECSKYEKFETHIGTQTEKTVDNFQCKKCSQKELLDDLDDCVLWSPAITCSLRDGRDSTALVPSTPSLEVRNLVKIVEDWGEEYCQKVSMSPSLITKTEETEFPFYKEETGHWKVRKDDDADEQNVKIGIASNLLMPSVEADVEDFQKENQTRSYLSQVSVIEEALSDATDAMHPSIIAKNSLLRSEQHSLDSIEFIDSLTSFALSPLFTPSKENTEHTSGVLKTDLFHIDGNLNGFPTPAQCLSKPAHRDTCSGLFAEGASIPFYPAVTSTFAQDFKEPDTRGPYFSSSIGRPLEVSSKSTDNLPISGKEDSKYDQTSIYYTEKEELCSVFGLPQALSTSYEEASSFPYYHETISASCPESCNTSYSVVTTAPEISHLSLSASDISINVPEREVPACVSSKPLLSFSKAFPRSIKRLYHLADLTAAESSPSEPKGLQVVDTEGSGGAVMTATGEQSPPSPLISPIPEEIESSFYWSPTVRHLDMSNYVKYFDVEKIVESDDPEIEFSKQMGRCKAIDEAISSDYKQRQCLGQVGPEPKWLIDFMERRKKLQIGRNGRRRRSAPTKQPFSFQKPKQKQKRVIRGRQPPSLSVPIAPKTHSHEKSQQDCCKRVISPVPTSAVEKQEPSNAVIVRSIIVDESHDALMSEDVDGDTAFVHLNGADDQKKN